MNNLNIIVAPYSKLLSKEDFKNLYLPKKANDSDVAYDCFAREIKITSEFVEYFLGFKIQVPEKYGAFLAARSSCSKHNLTLANGIGIIDPYYKDEVRARFYYNEKSKFYNIGDRVAQIFILPIPEINFIFKSELNDNCFRGGFGSTGN
jgi:dUTP pyrophosphatase